MNVKFLRYSTWFLAVTVVFLAFNFNFEPRAAGPSLFGQGTPHFLVKTVSEQPDLLGLDNSVNTVGGSLYSLNEGWNGTFMGIIDNNGIGDASNSFTNNFEIDLGRDGTIDVVRISNAITLKAGKTSTVTSSNGWVAVLGNHQIRLCADQPDVNAESNESNNCGSWQLFTVSPPPKPDLVAVLDPVPNVSAGATINFSGIVQNQGDGDATAFRSHFCVDAVDSGACYTSNPPSRLGEDFFYPNLGAGVTSGANASAGWTAGPAGTYTVFWCVDVWREVAESNESVFNNCVFITFTVVVPECMDGVDNLDPEDAFIDIDDPGCHTDGNRFNPNSYNSNDNSEGQSSFREVFAPLKILFAAIYAS